MEKYTVEYIINYQNQNNIIDIYCIKMNSKSEENVVVEKEDDPRRHICSAKRGNGTYCTLRAKISYNGKPYCGIHAKNAIINHPIQ